MADVKVSPEMAVGQPMLSLPSWQPLARVVGRRGRRRRGMVRGCMVGGRMGLEGCWGVVGMFWCCFCRDEEVKQRELIRMVMSEKGSKNNHERRFFHVI